MILRKAGLEGNPKELAHWLRRLDGVLALLASLTVAATPYDTALADLEVTRKQLATLWKKKPAVARAQARHALLDHVDRSAFPAWAGTPWAFYGTSTTPKEGTIACGYYVTTVLEHAHVKLERVTLAQQASAYLVQSLARGSKVEWLRPADSAEAVAGLRKAFPGERLLVVGFDYHAGFVRLSSDGTAAFCHSSVLGSAAVLCEDPISAPAFVSALYVAADTLNDALIDDWLLGRAVPSILPKHPRRT